MKNNPIPSISLDAHNLRNSYLLDRAHIQEPPKSIPGMLRHLGPSLIVTANVVGSGELIMTTTLGAKAGFVTLWIVLVSCLVKVAMHVAIPSVGVWPWTGIATLAAFGITGISADEIISYPYWCLEKGYARFAGPCEASEDWVRRARGWIKVMYLDAFLSMVIYTLATAAFYVLGAAVLHGRGEVPKGNEMIRTLSHIYTESLFS